MGCPVLTKFSFKKDSIWLKRFYIFSISLARRVQFSNFIGLFCRKSKLPEPKCFILWHWRAMKSLDKNWWFPNHSPKKLVNLFPGGERVYFLGSDLETTIKFLAKRFISPQCHKMKFVWKFFVQAICLLDKTNQ